MEREMKRNKILLLVSISLLLGMTGVFAQTYEVLIQCNVSGASIYVDGTYVGDAPVAVDMQKGRHRLKASAPGYFDKEVNYNVVKKANVQLTLDKGGDPVVTPVPQPTTAVFTQFKLTVNANVAGAQVYINGALRGKTPFVMMIPVGTYELKVTAGDFEDYVQNISIGADASFNVNLQQSVKYYALTVNANLPGARLYVNGQDSGLVPVSLNLPEGDYQIKVSLPNYTDYNQSLRLNRSTKINAVLTAITARLKIILPNFDNKNDSKRDSMRRIEIYIDGKRYNNDLEFDLSRGNHTIRIVSGAFAAEATLNLEGGRVYEVRPNLVLDIK
jgi:hypothetical protein